MTTQATHTTGPLERLRHHVSGAIERGESAPIVWIPARDMSALPDFELGYFTAAFWTADDGAGSGEYANTGRADEHFARLHPDNLSRQLSDCARFQRENAETLAECESYQAGIDFWLTRNRHGSGFWDGDYDHLDGTGEAAQRLTDAAHAFGEVWCSIYEEGTFIE